MIDLEFASLAINERWSALMFRGLNKQEKKISKNERR
jgi:hypothetical protein